MVVKAIINAIGKNKVKPKEFPIGTQKFTKDETDTLLEQSQSKIESIEAGQTKAVDRGNLIPQEADFLTVKTSDVAPNLAPKKVGYKVQAPKPSSKQAVGSKL